jgi:hypothetical protein
MRRCRDERFQSGRTHHAIQRMPNSVTAINKILTDLPAKVPNVVERAFLGEALKC